jgi:hypothetical protein
MNKYKWILIAVAAILTATLIYKCNDGEEKFVTKESTEFVKVVDSLNNIIVYQETIIDTLLTKVDASDRKINRLKTKILPAKEIIKYENIRIDSFIRNADDAAKREFLSNELRN